MELRIVGCVGQCWGSLNYRAGKDIASYLNLHQTTLYTPSFLNHTIQPAVLRRLYRGLSVI
jgi:hypothetical protein